MATNKRFICTLGAALLALSLAMPQAASAKPHNREQGAPEVDPSTVSGALALAVGGVAVLTNKLRRKK